MKKDIIVIIIIALIILLSGCLNKNSSKNGFIRITFVENTTVEEVNSLMESYNITKDQYSIHEEKIGTSDENTYNALIITIDEEKITNVQEFCDKMSNEKLVYKCILDYPES